MARTTGYGCILCVALCLSACSSGPSARPTPLLPVGTHADAPPQVRHIVTGSPAEEHLDVGDAFIAIDGVEVKTTDAFYTSLTATSQTFTVKKLAGTTVKLPVSEIMSDEGMLTAWALEPGTTITFDQNVPVYGDVQEAGLVYVGQSMGLVTSSIWNTNPRYIELYIDLHIPDSCHDCRLDNVAVMDWERKSWLAPVNADQVAWNLFPSSGQAPAPMAVPPPTPVGYTASSHGWGQASGYSQGNRFSGTYSGTTATTVTPTYDYTMTNMANAYNLGAALTQARIQADNNARDTFVRDRYTNFRLGALNPGERVTGYVQFAVPNGFTGPFVVAFEGTENAFIMFQSDE